MKKKIIVSLILIALVIGAVLLVKHKQKSLNELKAPAGETVSLQLYAPHYQPTSLSIEALAEVGSDHEVIFIPRFGAMVRSIAPLGSTVKKGSLILQLDDTDIKTDLLNLSLELSAAKEDLSAKQTLYETLRMSHARTTELLSIGGASKEQSQNEQAQLAASKSALMSAQSRIDTLNAKIKMANNLLGYTRLIAPYDGIVTQKEANTGDFIPLGKPILTFSGYDGKYLKVKLPQNESPKTLLYHSKKVPVVALESSPDGLATFVARPASIDETTGSRIELPLVAYDANATYLPANTLLRRNDGDTILLYKDGKVIAKKVLLEYCNASGCATQEHLEGAQLLQGSPDALLRALSGTAVSIGR